MNKMITFLIFALLLYSNLMAENGTNLPIFSPGLLLKQTAQYSINQNEMKMYLCQSSNYFYAPTISFIQDDSIHTYNSKDGNFKNAALMSGKQFLIGGLCGIGCVFLSGTIFNLAIGDQGTLGSGLAYGLPIIYLGYTAGTSFGVYIAGNCDKVQGNFLSTLSGGLLGSALGAGIFFLADQKGPLCSALVIGAPIGSIIGYNLFKKEKHQ